MRMSGFLHIAYLPANNINKYYFKVARAMVKIISDSAADIERNEIEKMNISVVELSVYIGDREYKEDILHSRERFYRYLKSSSELPRTSQPSPYAYERILKKAKDRGDEVIVVTVSSALSGSYQSALLARDLLEYDNCYIIDSFSASAGQRLVVNEALRLRDCGKSAREISEILKSFVPRISVFACIDDIKYLYGGGRHTDAAVIAGPAGRVKPVVSIGNGGSVILESKAIGMRHGINHMLSLIRNSDTDAHYPLYIMHTNALKTAEYFAKLLESKGVAECKNNIVSVGSAVGSHIGEGSVGAAFVINKKNQRTEG